MQFQHYNLGHQSQGAVVEVTLSGNAANVRLLDSTNLQNYRSGRTHRYIGGLMRRSPARLTIPRTGNWHVVVDFQGLRGQCRSSVRVIPRATLSPLPPLPEYSSSSSLSPLVQAVHQENSIERTLEGSEPFEHYDVFICHATEDKDDIVRPLTNALIAEDLRVWYDEFELRIGDSLRRKIDSGLSRSRFGVVIISHSFFAKNWTQYELNGLVTREMTGEQVILPIWHQISKSEVIEKSPSLADKVARNTSEFTIDEIACEIAEVTRASL